MPKLSEEKTSILYVRIKPVNKEFILKKAKLEAGDNQSELIDQIFDKLRKKHASKSKRIL